MGNNKNVLPPTLDVESSATDKVVFETKVVSRIQVSAAIESIKDPKEKVSKTLVKQQVDLVEMEQIVFDDDIPVTNKV